MLKTLYHALWMTVMLRDKNTIKRSRNPNLAAHQTEPQPDLYH